MNKEYALSIKASICVCLKIPACMQLYSKHKYVLKSSGTKVLITVNAVSNKYLLLQYVSWKYTTYEPVLNVLQYFVQTMLKWCKLILKLYSRFQKFISYFYVFKSLHRLWKWSFRPRLRARNFETILEDGTAQRPLFYVLIHDSVFFP